MGIEESSVFEGLLYEHYIVLQRALLLSLLYELETFQHICRILLTLMYGVGLAKSPASMLERKS